VVLIEIDAEEGGYYPQVPHICTLLTRCADLFWCPNLNSVNSVERFILGRMRAKKKKRDLGLDKGFGLMLVGLRLKQCINTIVLGRVGSSE
jgi:hypothetical protein